MNWSVALPAVATLYKSRFRAHLEAPTVFLCDTVCAREDTSSTTAAENCFQRREQGGLPQDVLRGIVPAAHGVKHGLSAQQAQTPQLLVQSLPRGAGRTGEAGEKSFHSGVRRPCWDDGAQCLKQLYGVLLGLDDHAHQKFCLSSKRRTRVVSLAPQRARVWEGPAQTTR